MNEDELSAIERKAGWVPTHGSTHVAFFPEDSATILKLVAEVRRLQEDLSTFGSHQNACGQLADNDPCICGFRNALPERFKR